jgi:Domain of unknown function (DUF4936)
VRALFIYWKVPPERLAGALAAAREFQAGLSRCHASVVAGLYQRAEGGAALVTLMETYTRPGGLDAPAVSDIIDGGHAALAAWCQAGRHVEQFDLLGH